MRFELTAIAAVFASVLVASGAGAQSYTGYPTQPIRVMVVTAAGGGSDITMRVVADKASQGLKQSIIVENRPGASGAIGAEMVAKAAPDGYTLLCGTSTTVVMLPVVNPKLPYDPVRDYAAIGQMTRGNILIVVRDTLPAASVAEFVRHAKANPGKLSYGTAGVGTTQHLAAELFSQEAGIDMIHVPYKGTALAASDLMTGRIDLMFDNVAPAMTSIKQGKARAIAVASANRVAGLPDTPTTREAGYPQLEVQTWVGLFAPRGTPKPIVDRLSGELKRVMSLPEVVDKLVAAGNDLAYSTPEQFAAYTKAEIEKWRGVVNSRNLKFE